MSAMALMREGRRRDSDIQHYAVYPGRPGDRSPLLEGMATGWSAVPIRTWQKQSWQSITGLLRWLRTQVVSGFGTRGRLALRSLARRWNIDVIHTNTAIVSDGARVAGQLGIPHVWHIRERIGAGGFMEFPMTDGELVRFIAGTSVKVPVISRYVQQIFTRHGLKKATALVHDGIDVEALQGSEVAARGQTLRKRWGVPQEAVLVGMVGGLKTTVKRHDLFLEMAREVASRHPEARFVIVGSIPPPLERARNTWAGRILARAKASGLADRLLFPGFVEDMPAVWSAMDIYMHLCPVEGFSRAILEAMASATPVVAVDAGGNPEAVSDKETGLLVRGDDPSSYAGAVESLMDDPQKRRRLAENGARVARDHFSVGKHYETMRRLFEAAVTGGGSAG